MNKKEYMNTLCEQIGNKYAKQLVSAEYENHIEDQKAAYMEEGMTEEEAERQAVRQMGDPIEAGGRLNKIHRPIFPKGLFIIALMLTGIGIVMQSIGFEAQDSEYVRSYYLLLTILYNVIGLLIMGAILFFDYNYLVQYAYRIYAAYLVVYVVMGLLAANGSIGPVYIAIGYAQAYTANYFLLHLLPVILAPIIYRNKGRGMKGLLKCAGMALLPLLLQMLFWEYGLFSAALEYLLVVYVVLFFAVCKKIFAQKRRGMLILMLLAAVAVISMPCVVVTQNPGGVLAEYQMARLRFLFAMLKDPSGYAETAGYIVLQLRDTIQNLSLWGNHALPPNIPANDMYATFIITGIFAWFGTIVGCIVVGLLFFFCVRALYISFRQANRIGMLVGMTCSVSLLLRSIVGMAVNFGFGLYYTTSIPFLSYGRWAVFVNAIYVGLILCICRSSRIMPERESAPTLNIS